MKAYLLTSGTIFALVAAMHLGTIMFRWRMLASDPWFAAENGLLGALGLSLAVWGFRLARD